MYTATMRPFLKWAGGKTKLLPELEAHLADAGGPRYPYCEPFLGGGALFFAAGRCAPQTLLRDLNVRLVDTYIAVRDQLEEIIEHLRRLQCQHSPEHYKSVRDTFNASYNPVHQAARLIYLNKTCFNGLYRVNKHGAFNVPMGRYKNPCILDEPALRAASTALAGAVIELGDFRELPERLTEPHFVYLDPPYVPVSRQSDFTSYVPGGFGTEDQAQLREVFGELDRCGHKLLLSNSIAAKSLYTDYHIDIVSAPRAVNSKGGKRGPVDEILVRNY